MGAYMPGCLHADRQPWTGRHRRGNWTLSMRTNVHSWLYLHYEKRTFEYAQGGAVERILLEAARANTAHDVVLCIGDDRSDEDMYTAIEHVAVMPHLPAEVRRGAFCLARQTSKASGLLQAMLCMHGFAACCSGTGLGLFLRCL